MKINHNYNTRQTVKIIKAIKTIQRSMRGRIARKKIRALKKCNICSICLEKIKYNDCVILIKCQHVFHKNCLATWFEEQYNCPNCRSEIILPPKKSSFINFFRHLFG